MLRVVILLCAIFALFDITRFVWIAADELPHEAYVSLMADPPTLIDTPQSNGYFLLLGFTVAATADPVQAAMRCGWSQRAAINPLTTAERVVSM